METATVEAPVTSTETATPAAPVTTTPEVSTPEAPTAEVFVSNMKQSAMKRDVKTVREQHELLRGKREPKKTEDKVATPAATTDTKAPVKTEAPKGKFVVGDGDGRIELNDVDGMLGYKTPEELKKGFANQVKRIQMDKTWLQEAEQKVTAEKQRADAVAAELATAKIELEKYKTTQTAAVAQPSALEKPNPKFQVSEMPKPPVVPPADDGSEEATTAIATYAKERVIYEENLAKWVQESVSKTAQHAEQLVKAGISVDSQHPLLKDMAEVKKAIAELQGITNEVKQTKAQLESERKANEYWNSIDEFQRLHPEAATPIPMKELHKAIWDDGTNLTWMDYVALSNGVSRPVTSDSNTWNQYFQNRLSLTQKFLDGDKDVISKTEAAGVEPPTGYREYFDSAKRIRDLDTEHRRLIEQGLLGPKSTRQMAWEYTNKGNLSDQIKTMEQKAHSEGASTVINALRGHDAEHAVVIPPELSQSGTTPMSEKQVAEMLKQTAEKARDPEFLAKLRAITTRKK